MQIKASVSHHLTLVRMVLIEKINIDECVEHKETLGTDDGNVEKRMRSTKELKMEPSQEPAV